MVWPCSSAVGIRLGRHLAEVQQDFARVVSAIVRFEPVELVVDPSALAGRAPSCDGRVTPDPHSGR